MLETQEKSRILLADHRVQAARFYAYGAHNAIHQKRKRTGERYEVHLDAVALRVSLIPHATVEDVMTAYLHDVVEDPKNDPQDIEFYFGSVVRTGVEWLSDVSKPEDGNRAARKLKDAEHIKAAPRNIKSIKLADSEHNMLDIIKSDPNFAPTYIREKDYLIEHSLQDGDPELLASCRKIIRDFKDRK